MRYKRHKIQYPNAEEIYINVSVPLIPKKLPIAFWAVLSRTNHLYILLNIRNCNIQSNNQPSTVRLALMKNHNDQTNKQSPRARLAFCRKR